jgi:hypothetical protein
VRENDRVIQKLRKEKFYLRVALSSTAIAARPADDNVRAEAVVFSISAAGTGCIAFHRILLSLNGAKGQRTTRSKNTV